MNKKVKLLQLILIILISGFAGYYIGVNHVQVAWQNYRPSLSVVNREAPAPIANVDFSLFWTVWQRLETDYYDKTKLDPRKMLNGAIEGLAQSLGDPYTMYLPPKQNTNFKDGLAGQFSGIGAELGTKDKQIIVVAPLTGSPAQKAGIKAGDTILKVNDEIIINWSLQQAVEKIRGPKGTPVVLTILTQGSNTPKNVKIIRDTITVKSVEGWIKNVKCQKSNVKCQILDENEKCKDCEKIAYIRLSQFGDSTNQDWLSLINKMDLQMQKERVKGLILDLRNNPGGYLTDAVYISSDFLREGTRVVLQENGQGFRTTLSVTRKGLMQNVPLIVLINKGSASASEIVGGALRDNKRALLLGETSFGKGTIQEAADLGNGAGLHITIAKWQTPNGTWVNGKGLTPDIQVALDSKDPSHDTQLEKAIMELLK